MNLFDLVATLSLDTSEYEEGVKKSSKVMGGLGKAVSGFAKVGAVALGATTTAVSALTKSSIDAYANFEQLSGGIQKLYGDASDQMMEYAKNAYKTSGMSANTYMQNATAFSASLINSLGGDVQKASEQTDLAMRAISDNVNTFGMDMESVTNAYKGFARQNYTMLDNLSLGYAGTKEGMEQLIKDANEYGKATGQASDLTIESFSDIITAIDLVQQKQSIAGTTAKEASTTIEGALNMTKSAWENLLTGLADPEADFGALVDNLVTSIVGEGEGEGLLNQIIPAIERALQGIGQLVEKSAPIISSAFPKLIGQVLPALVSSASALLTGLVSALPDLIQVLADQAPMIIETLVGGLQQALPVLLEAVPMIIETLVNGLTELLPELIPVAVEMLSQLVLGIAENLPLLIESGIALIKALIQGLIEAIPVLIQNLPQILMAIVNGLLQGAGMLLEVGIDLILDFLAGIIKAGATLFVKVYQFAQNIPEKIKEGISNIWQVGKNIVSGIWNGISGGIDWLKQKISGWVDDVMGFLKGLFGIASPSKWARDVIGLNIAKGMALGIADGEGLVQSAFDDIVPDYDMGEYAMPFEGAEGEMAGRWSIVNYITVDGAEAPEEYASRFVHELKMELRTV